MADGRRELVRDAGERDQPESPRVEALIGALMGLLAGRQTDDDGNVGPGDDWPDEVFEVHGDEIGRRQNGGRILSHQAEQRRWTVSVRTQIDAIRKQMVITAA